MLVVEVVLALFSCCLRDCVWGSVLFVVVFVWVVVGCN